MKKIEYIWRHLLTETFEKKRVLFRQQDLASKFSISSSTVNFALKPLRELGAVRVNKKGFEVSDWEKILYHWANHRRLIADIHSQIRINLPILEIENRLPNGTIPTAYTAVRKRFGEPPADYDKIYCYHPSPKTVVNKFLRETVPGPNNLFILIPDPFLSSTVALVQLFADLWSLPDWFAKDFVNEIRDKIDVTLPIWHPRWS